MSVPDATGSSEKGVVVLDGVSKTFGKDGRTIPALENVTFGVQKGEFVSIVGPSGCGKSTLLNFIAGVAQPTAGKVMYAGAPVDQVNTRVGYITQQDNLLPWRTAWHNIALSLDIRRDSTAEQRRKRVAEVITLMGLDGFEGHYPWELSGGMRKRVSMARTLVYRPDTVLMDEPLGALDAQLKLVLQAEIARLVALVGSTVIFVTHDLTEAIALSDRVIVMSARPGTVRAVHEVNLPRPRDVLEIRFAAEFKEIHDRLWGILTEGLEVEAQRKGKAR